jgi:hypothetical protein
MTENIVQCSYIESGQFLVPLSMASVTARHSVPGGNCIVVFEMIA